MRKPLYSFLLPLTLALSISAQTAQVAMTDYVEKNLREHIEYLGSEALEGQRTGDPGAGTAAGYVVNDIEIVRGTEKMTLNTVPVKRP